MDNKKKEELEKTPSRTNILRYRPKKYDTRKSAEEETKQGTKKYPPKNL